MVAPTEFRDLVEGFDGTSLREVVVTAKSGDEADEARLAAAMLWAGFCCPAGVRPLYNSIAAVWRGWGAVENVPAGLPSAALTEAFWTEFWAAIEQGRKVVYTPTTSTARIAAMARQTGPDFLALAERCAADYVLPGTDDIDPEAWAACPPGTLGHELLAMLESRTYDPDIGARRELRTLPPTVRRLCAHVDRFDGVWHTVLDYDSIDSHLIAFSAFTLAQTVHPFSASALAFFSGMAQLVVPNGLSILMHLIAEGWHHGRRTPSMVEVDWQPYWAESVDAVRHRLAVTPYRSVFSKGLFSALPRYAEN